MEALIVLGTGYAMATRCYNTCFAVHDGRGAYLLVDAGGGNGILVQLEKAGIDPREIHEMIVTHEHCDHLLGVVWVLRKVASMMESGAYEGELRIYCHSGLAPAIRTLASLTLQKKFTRLIGKRILLCPVEDGEARTVLSRETVFFDIHSTKARQFGFMMCLADGRKLACLGDEPYNPLCAPYVQGADWLLAEAFCLYADRERFSPYEKHHSTVKDACELATRLAAPHLVLWHTEDRRYERRKALYTAEGAQYYHGDLHVPEDLETILLAP